MSALDDARAFVEPWGLPDDDDPRAVQVVRALIAEHERLTATPAGAGPGEVDNSPKRLAYEVKMMLSSVASHGPAALTTTSDPMYTARLLGRLRDAIERLTAPPTDDDREALVLILDATDNWVFTGAHVTFRPDLGAGAILAAGFRRQEPLTDAQVEAAAKASFEVPNGDGDYTWAEMVRDDPSRADIWRADARAILEAARAAS